MSLCRTRVRKTRHGLMPQYMANEMPDYMPDDECKMDHVLPHTA